MESREHNLPRGLLSEAELVDPLVLGFLFPHVFTDCIYVHADSRNEVSPRPEVLTDEVSFLSNITPGDVYSAHAFDLPDHL